MKEKIKLLCANDATMWASGHMITNITVNNDLVLNANCLLVDNLAVECIIGMDQIKTLEFDQNENYILLNGVKVARHCARYGTLLEDAILFPNSISLLKIKNPFSSAKTRKVLIENKAEKSDIFIQSGVHNNDVTCTVLASNQTDLPIVCFRNEIICNISLVYENEIVSAVQVVNSELENSLQNEFQKTRREKYCPNNIYPSECNIGEISADRQEELKKILTDNCLAFSWGPQDLGKCHYFRFEIPLYEKNSVAYEPPRPVPPALFAKVKDGINEWLKLGIIEESNSNFNIPLIILRKPNGTIRTSLDARKLNSIAKLDRYPLPNLRDTVYRIGEKYLRVWNVL